ncbi:XRE family transcriptional regulator [Serratia ureilytica]|uniref:XRE family transcriptional regulator n=1 Tax=Serratia ureilytica TaxID=300181 RepID=UPI00191E75FD|nr:helix-turn-helix transcriptional regulator [Serratia ureilytica]MBL0878090.1 helix-turn-helix transcriptional regulator [Serratia ureilytica]MDN2470351.1 helix-turn-helix transcriptional regulator [Serratia ureilytica]
MKKTTFSERLNQAMKESGFTQNALAEAVGMAQPSVWKLVSGGAKGSKKTAQIANVLGVRAEWLAEGTEPMRDITTESKRIDLTDSIRDDSDIYRVEVLDLVVSAGPGSYMLSEVVEVLNAIEFTSDRAKALFGHRAAHDVKVMTVDGDSMSPTIKSGDRLFFDVAVREFTTDGVYAFVYGKTFHVKRLQMQGTKLAVLSDNPHLEKWYIDENTEDQFFVMGKALLHESIMYGKL